MNIGEEIGDFEVEPNPFFGKRHNAPAWLGAKQVPTPVGEKCLWCEEEIEEGDDGWLTGLVEEGGARVVPLHAECQFRSIVGSVGHIQRKCSCFGGTEEDPPGMTKREAAQAAEREFQKQILRTEGDEHATV